MIRFVYNNSVDNTVICLNNDGDIVLNVDKQSTLDLFYACFKDMDFFGQDKLIDDIMKTEAYKRAIIKSNFEKDFPECPVSNEPGWKDDYLEESKAVFNFFQERVAEKFNFFQERVAEKLKPLYAIDNNVCKIYCPKCKFEIISKNKMMVNTNSANVVANDTYNVLKIDRYNFERLKCEHCGWEE